MFTFVGEIVITMGVSGNCTGVNILMIFSAHDGMNSHTLMETKIVWPKVGLGE